MQAAEFESLSPWRGVLRVRRVRRPQGEILALALREVLASELEGVGVTGFRVPGVTTVFEPCEAVEEGLAELVLNLAAVRLRGDSKTGVLAFSCEGPLRVTGEILARQLGLSVANPETHLLTVPAGRRLSLELRIERGSGSFISGGDGDVDATGMIPVSVTFCPLLCSVNLGRTEATSTLASGVVGAVDGEDESYDLELTLDTLGGADAATLAGDAIRRASELLRALSEGLLGGA